MYTYYQGSFRKVGDFEEHRVFEVWRLRTAADSCGSPICYATVVCNQRATLIFAKNVLIIANSIALKHLI